MKTGNYLLLIILAYLSGTTIVFSQDSIKHTPFFIPQSLSFNVNSNFHWYVNDGINTNFTDQMFVRADLKYSRNFDLIIINKTKSYNSDLQNRFSDAYFNYRNNFKADASIPIFRYGSYLDLKVGVIEWYPTFTNVQLILENAEKFLNPPQIYGGSLVSRTPLTNDRSLNVHLSAHTGDLINHKLDPQLLDLYLNYTKLFKYQLGISTQVGIAQGSKHVVNFAQILYQPKLENMQLDFKLGKLPTYDETPYGIHLGFTRKFKFISLGGYYERRLDQNTKGEIAGVQWSIVGPPKLAQLVSTFNLFYDFNTNTVWMWVPLIKIDISYK